MSLHRKCSDRRVAQGVLEQGRCWISVSTIGIGARCPPCISRNKATTVDGDKEVNRCLSLKIWISRTQEQQKAQKQQTPCKTSFAKLPQHIRDTPLYSSK